MLDITSHYGWAAVGSRFIKTNISKSVYVYKLVEMGEGGFLIDDWYKRLSKHLTHKQNIIYEITSLMYRF